MSNAKPMKLVLALKTERYKGETYYKLEGWVKGETRSIVVSIPCDDRGNPKPYTSRDNTPLVIGSINIVSGQRQRRNF